MTEMRIARWPGIPVKRFFEMVSRIITRFSRPSANPAPPGAPDHSRPRPVKEKEDRRVPFGFPNPLTANGLRRVLSMAGARFRQIVRPVFSLKLFFENPAAIFN